MWDLIKNNGWAKLSAFLLALFLFILVKANDYKEEALEVPRGNILIVNRPDDLEIANYREDLLTRNVIVHLSGPTELMIEARRLQNYVLNLDVGSLSPGQHEVQLDPSMLGARDYTRRLPAIQRAVRRFSPRSLRVVVELYRRRFQVVVPYVVERSDGLEVEPLRCEPSSIDLTGQRESLESLEKRTPPFMVTCDSVTINDDSPTLPDDPSTVYMVTQMPSEISSTYPDVRVADPNIQQVTAYFKLRPGGSE